MIKQFNNVIKISDKDEIVQKNFLEGLDFISNLNLFIDVFTKTGIADKDVTYLPSFFGRFVSEELCRASTAEENEMRVFILKSNCFLEDDIIQRIFSIMEDYCQINRDNDIITFILKEEE